MELYVHKSRNVVVKREGDVGTDKALVAFVTLSDSVVGQARRGRKPNYDVAVLVSDLVAVESPSAELLARAEKALTGMVAVEDEVVTNSPAEVQAEAEATASFDPTAE